MKTWCEKAPRWKIKRPFRSPPHRSNLSPTLSAQKWGETLSGKFSLFIDVSILESLWIIWWPWGVLFLYLMIQHEPLNKWLTSDSSDDSDIKRIYSPSISFYLQVFGVLQSFWNLNRSSHCTSSVSGSRATERVLGGWVWRGCTESCDTFLGVFTCQQMAPGAEGGCSVSLYLGWVSGEYI